MTEAEIVMVAERAVGQQINDLRGELGVKFHEIENGDNGLKSLKSEIENEMSTLNDNLTDAFTQNNALLRREIQAMKGDMAEDLAAKLNIKMRENQEHLEKKINELEKNINISLENIKENANRMGSKQGNEDNERGDNKGNTNTGSIRITN